MPDGPPFLRAPIHQNPDMTATCRTSQTADHGGIQVVQRGGRDRALTHRAHLPAIYSLSTVRQEDVLATGRLREVELSGEPHVIERPVGEPSKVAYVRRGTLVSPPLSKPESRTIEPAGPEQRDSRALLG